MGPGFRKARERSKNIDRVLTVGHSAAVGRRTQIDQESWRAALISDEDVCGFYVAINHAFFDVPHSNRSQFECPDPMGGPALLWCPSQELRWGNNA
jgi:hypothetical protein